jgi:hypothetical protein
MVSDIWIFYRAAFSGGGKEEAGHPLSSSYEPYLIFLKIANCLLYGSIKAN